MTVPCRRCSSARTARSMAAGRAVTVQALGGTGGLKIGADFLRRFAPSAQVWISDPSWENHRALFEGAGFKVNAYPYYDPTTHGVDFAAMQCCARAAARRLDRRCCMRAATIRPVSDPDARRSGRGSSRSSAARGLVPFLDIAYQGFADGIDADGAVVRRFAATPGPLFVSNSFSKSFSLYGERVGALTVRRGRPGRSGTRAVAVQAHRFGLTTRIRRRTAARSWPPFCCRRNSARCGRPSSPRCATGSS